MVPIFIVHIFQDLLNFYSVEIQTKIRRFDPGHGSTLEHWSDTVQLFLIQVTAILIYSIIYIIYTSMRCFECNPG